MKLLYVTLNEEDLDNLRECIEKNHAFISSFIIKESINDRKLAVSLEENLEELLCCLNQVYDSGLVELKRQVGMCYQTWVSLKDTFPTAAKAVYREYLKLKCDLLHYEFQKLDERIEEMELESF